MNLLHFSTLIEPHLAAVVCSVRPNAAQMVMIAGLVMASGAFVLAAGVSAMSVAILLVQLIMAGSSVAEITTTIGALTGGAASAEAAIGLIGIIKGMLGC